MKPWNGPPEGWNDLIAGLPGAHFLQTWQWGRIKAAYGWQPQPWVWQHHGGPAAAALVLKRRLGPGLSVLYLPRGPLLDWTQEDLQEQVLEDLQSLARRQRALWLKIDPDLPVAFGEPGSPEEHPHPPGQAAQKALSRRGWRYSSEQVQFPNTVWVDLTADERTILARMKQKTRYNIRLATRKGVRVRVAQQAADWDWLYRMYADTAQRDGFLIRPRAYYRRVWQVFTQAGLGEGLLAEVEGEVVAGAFIPRFAGRAWYFHGMSRPVHRNRMPTYAVQWTAMQRAKAAGCRVYDMWGAPTHWQPEDPLWGVWRFKRGFGGQVVRTLAAWDYAPWPWLYAAYARLRHLPRRSQPSHKKAPAAQATGASSRS